MDLSSAIGGYLQGGSPLAYVVAFAAGVGVSFTPCVYPVLPITAAYVGARSGGSRARGFVLSLSQAVGMSAVYAAMGTAAALTGSLFGALSAHPAANLAVGNACILMALAMLDVFAVPLPAFFKGGASAGRERGGVAGGIVMGLASGLVVGPCTAPVLGALLAYVGARGNVPFGASLLFAFGLGMGTLPVLVGTFTGLLAALPRSGRWLGAVKKGFALLLIAVGEYFIVQAGRALV